MLSKELFCIHADAGWTVQEDSKFGSRIGPEVKPFSITREPPAVVPSHGIQTETARTEKLRRDLARPGPEHTLLFDLDGPKPVEAKGPRLAAHVVEAEQIPGGP